MRRLLFIPAECAFCLLAGGRRYFFNQPGAAPQIRLQFNCHDPSATCFCQENGICCSINVPGIGITYVVMEVCDAGGEWVL